MDRFHQGPVQLLSAGWRRRVGPHRLGFYSPAAAEQATKHDHVGPPPRHHPVLERGETDELCAFLYRLRRLVEYTGQSMVTDTVTLGKQKKTMTRTAFRKTPD